VREGACIGAATMLQPWTLRLILNAAVSSVPVPCFLEVHIGHRHRCVCVFITAVPITKLFARGVGEVEDMCSERLRAEAGVN